MPYTEASFKSWMVAKGALYYKGAGQLVVNPWEAGAAAAHPKGVGVTAVSVITAWKVYKKCFEEKEDMIMGRLSDTANYYAKFGLATDGVFNLSKGDQHINVQKLDKWTTVINDCWLLGAVNACKTFRLVSPVKNVEDNVYNYKAKMFVVTGRELTGLRIFGYTPSIAGGAVSFMCKNQSKAANATFQEYAEFMNKAANSPVQKAKTALFAQGIM